jgi:hypothetical protein
VSLEKNEVLRLAEGHQTRSRRGLLVLSDSPDEKTRRGGDPPVPSLFGPLVFLRRTAMDIETLGIMLGAVLPIYPVLFTIHQKIGQYDEIVEEFKKLREEHESHKERYHGT